MHCHSILDRVHKACDYPSDKLRGDYLIRASGSHTPPAFRVHGTMKRLERRLRGTQPNARNLAIVVSTAQGTTVVPIHDRSADNYARIWTGRKSYLLRESLRTLERRVAAHGFARAPLCAGAAGQRAQAGMGQRRAFGGVGRGCEHSDLAPAPHGFQFGVPEHDVMPNLSQSERNDSSGFVSDARLAGIQLAASATINNTLTAMASVVTSRASTP
jgi:hypothetical protein